ncbi:replication protein P [Avibacterium paragallinarum]|uniref:Replication protein P n=2 Tax=Avibacterium paragallinarum TaxID=728 RepID=A0AAE5THA6_AVIPA|nr:replication protein P [Avibacterium paragallinarum]MEE3609362.1 replication protein P [Avibacterium paragallinarum]MEE3621490.1 replication protein P [Avibacterium paragallinarum]MEE3669369.1 replication protein P [Avibacterium paragallinarum]MEE3681673.1 replication protein P [Avibacterium paragallinarum]MEE4386675.1 replication protein P [Avibacterium paragallinarum]
MNQVTATQLQNAIGREPSYHAPVGKQEIPPYVAKFVDRLFVRLKAIFPAWQAAFDGEEGYQEAKHLWLEALVNNGITTAAQFKRGIAQAERAEEPFFPSVGRFIKWCKQDRYAALGLPNEDKLYDRLKKFQGYGMLEAHKFQFESDAEYWLLTDLYCNNREATEEKLRKAIKKALEKMAERLEAGEILPARQITLPEKPSFIPPEKQREINLKGTAHCKAILYGARQ